MLEGLVRATRQLVDEPLIVAMGSVGGREAPRIVIAVVDARLIVPARPAADPRGPIDQGDVRALHGEEQSDAGAEETGAHDAEIVASAHAPARNTK